MTSTARPIVVVEDDPWLRLIQVVLDPETPADRTAAFAHFCAHDVPDFMGWRDRVRLHLPALHGALVRLVPDELAFPNVIVSPHLAGSPRWNALNDMEEVLLNLERSLAQKT